MSGSPALDADLVLFDLDGTLVETAPEICDAVNDTLRATGLPTVELPLVEDWIGHGTGHLLLQAVVHATGRAAGELRESSLWRAAQAQFMQDYERRCGTTSRLYPQALEVLHALGARGVYRALVTNKEERYTQPVLRRHGLRRMFEHVVCGDTLPTRKPDPAGVLACLHRFGVARERAVFVGDSSIDVQTARNAGVRAWALTHGYNMGEPIASAHPDRLLQSLGELLSRPTTTCCLP